MNLSWFITSRIGRALLFAWGVIVAVVAAWFGGKRSGKSDARADRAEGNANAAKESKEIRHEVETSDDTYLVDVLSGRVRPKR